MTRFQPLALALALALAVAAVPALAQPGEPGGPGSDNASSPPDEDARPRGNASEEPRDADRDNGTASDKEGQEPARGQDDARADNASREPESDANASRPPPENDRGNSRPQDEHGARDPPGGGRDDARGSRGVAIEDTPRGFASRGAAGSPRPAVSVDAERAEATVAPDGARPLATRLVDVVEFLDENGNGAFDLGEPVLARTALTDANMSIGVDDANASRLVAYALPGGGALALRFTLDPVDARAGAKFDVIVTDYPFTHEDARLAVGSRVTVPGGVDVQEVDGAPAITGVDGTRVPYLSWITTSRVDDREEPVAWSVHVSATGAGHGEDAIVYWAYAQGAVIVHDPVLGVTEIVEDVLGNPGAFAAGTAGALGALAIGYAARRRSRT